MPCLARMCPGGFGVARVSDVELTNLFAYALHRSGRNGHPDMDAARELAGVLVRVLNRTGLFVIHEERRDRREARPADLHPVEADEASGDHPLF